MDEKGGDTMDLRERILQYRARHNMSQEDFANLCQVNVMTINAIETRKRTPTQLTVTKIEMILKEEQK